MQQRTIAVILLFLFVSGCSNEKVDSLSDNRSTLHGDTNSSHFAIGSESMQDRLIGKWLPQSVNGKSLSNERRSQMNLEFREDGICKRSDEIGTFKVVDATTIQTEFGDHYELVAIEFKGDMLIMRIGSERELHAIRVD